MISLSKELTKYKKVGNIFELLLPDPNKLSLLSPCCHAETKYHCTADRTCQNMLTGDYTDFHLPRVRCTKCGKTHRLLGYGIVPHKRIWSGVLEILAVDINACPGINLVTAKDWKGAVSKIIASFEETVKEFKLKIDKKRRKLFKEKPFGWLAEMVSIITNTTGKFHLFASP